MNTRNVLIVGVGGQGVVMASNILAEAALKAGFDVKKTDTLGMAQRGGSVVSHLRYGASIASPMIPQGEADVLIAFEKLEAARWIHFLKPDGAAVINDLALPPLSVTLGNETYPTDSELIAMLRMFIQKVYLVPGTALAESLGNSKMVNTVLMGCSAGLLEIDSELLMSTMAMALPEKLRKMNLAAFEKGRAHFAQIVQQ
jgi:indolepyruvate ferredoxin oxidoreductase beta subunit